MEENEQEKVNSSNNEKSELETLKQELEELRKENKYMKDKYFSEVIAQKDEEKPYKDMSEDERTQYIFKQINEFLGENKKEEE